MESVYCPARKGDISRLAIPFLGAAFSSEKPKSIEFPELEALARMSARE